MNKNDLFKASLVCLFTASTSYGAGFALYEGSAAANADTAGVTAKGGEPGAIFFNPAAITGLPGTQIQGGVSVVAPQDSVTGVNPYTGQSLGKVDATENYWPLPHLYATHQLNDELWLGLGIYTRFGLGSEFAENWFGRYNNVDATIATFNVNPVVAWKANEWLSVAAGLSVQYFDISLKQKIDAAGVAGLRRYNDPSFSPLDIEQELCADGVGVGADLGVQIKPMDKVNVGLAYHSRIKQECEGKAEYKKSPVVKAAMPAFFNNTDIQGDVTLPDEIMSAITYDITDALTIGLGATYTMWSTYEELEINFDEPILPGKSQSVAEKDWSDVWRYTGGLSYDVNDAVTLRASYTYDDSPLNKNHLDYLVPADVRQIFAVGAGYKTGDWVFDVSYFYELIDDIATGAHVKEGVMPSDFTDGTAHCVGVSVTKKF